MPNSRQRFAARWAAKQEEGGNRRLGWTRLEDTLESSWQRQLHLFGSPFYYIEYGIAELGAMQMWMQSRRNAASALANYKKALALGGSRPLPELFETAGIRLDLSANVMQELAHETERALDALPV